MYRLQVQHFIQEISTNSMIIHLISSKHTTVKIDQRKNYYTIAFAFSKLPWEKQLCTFIMKLSIIHSRFCNQMHTSQSHSTPTPYTHCTSQFSLQGFKTELSTNIAAEIYLEWLKCFPEWMSFQGFKTFQAYSKILYAASKSGLCTCRWNYPWRSVA